VLPTPTVPSLTIDYHRQSDEELLHEMITTIYDLEADYHRMQQLLKTPQEERPRRFDGLRKNYPVRREFHRTSVNLPKNQERLRNLLAGIGFSEISEEE
jgi:erythronate-4-phosphate dehydrogenase